MGGMQLKQGYVLYPRYRGGMNAALRVRGRRNMDMFAITGQVGNQIKEDVEVQRGCYDQHFTANTIYRILYLLITARISRQERILFLSFAERAAKVTRSVVGF